MHYTSQGTLLADMSQIGHIQPVRFKGPDLMLEAVPVSHLQTTVHIRDSLHCLLSGDLPLRLDYSKLLGVCSDATC